MDTREKISKSMSNWKKLDKIAVISILLAVFVVVLPFFAAESYSNNPVILPGNVRYETGFYADGHLKSSPDGRSITLYPTNTVFPSTYIIKNGNELWTEYGKVATISMKSNGDIRISDCSTKYVRDAIAGTWKPKK